jgi:hypothetical protein
MSEPKPQDYSLTSEDVCNIHNKLNDKPIGSMDYVEVFAAVIISILFLWTAIVPIVVLSQVKWGRFCPISSYKMSQYIAYTAAHKKWEENIRNHSK